MEMLNGFSIIVSDPAAAANACAEPRRSMVAERNRSMVGVVIISQHFHNLKMIDVAKIVKWEEWGHGECGLIVTFDFFVQKKELLFFFWK